MDNVIKKECNKILQPILLPIISKFNKRGDIIAPISDIIFELILDNNKLPKIDYTSNYIIVTNKPISKVLNSFRKQLVSEFSDKQPLLLGIYIKIVMAYTKIDKKYKKYFPAIKEFNNIGQYSFYIRNNAIFFRWKNLDFNVVTIINTISDNYCIDLDGLCIKDPSKLSNNLLNYLSQPLISLYKSGTADICKYVSVEYKDQDDTIVKQYIALDTTILKSNDKSDVLWFKSIQIIKCGVGNLSLDILLNDSDSIE